MAYHGWPDASAAALRSRLPAALALRGSLAQSRAPIIEAIIHFPLGERGSTTTAWPASTLREPGAGPFTVLENSWPSTMG